MNGKNKNKRKHTSVGSIGSSSGVIQRIAKDMLSVFLEFSSDKRTLFVGGETTLALGGWTFQAMTQRVSTVSDSSADCFVEEQAVKKLLANELLINAEKIERQCAGAGVLFAKLFLLTLAESGKFNQNKFLATEQAKTDLAAIRLGLMQHFVQTPEIIDQKTGFLKTPRSTSDTSGICRHALNHAGLLGSVTVEKYKDMNGGAESIIGRNTGHQFRIDTMHAFTSSLALGEFGSWIAREVKVLIVDGVIATVAEIDKVLLGAAREKQPTLIAASFFDEEVVATVAANNLAGKTNIFLCLLPRDSLESVNMANDIATCCMAQPINSHTGHEMLSFIEYDALPAVDLIKIIPGANSLIISNPRSHNAVGVRIKELQEKTVALARESTSNHAALAGIELLNKRIANLMSDRVTVKVPTFRAGTIIPEIDTGIRLIKSLLQYGELKNTAALRKWLTTAPIDPGVKHVGTLLAKELGHAARENKHALPGFAPYIALWFAWTLAVQYLNTEYAVLRS